MKVILKPIFQWVIDQYELFENPVYNWVVALIIGVIGFKIAWNFVGNRYRNGSINGRAVGSILHWVVRFIAVSMMYLLVATVIWIIKLFLSVPWWGWLIVFGVLIVIAIIVFIVKRHRSRIVTTPNREEN